MCPYMDSASGDEGEGRFCPVTNDRLIPAGLAAPPPPPGGEVEGLIATAKATIRDDGFLFLINYAVSFDQVSDHMTE